MEKHVYRKLAYLLGKMIPIGILVGLLALPGLAQAQETVIGIVTDATNGETMPGVNIVVKGTATGTSTDGEGRFELDVPSLNDTLVVSFVGFTRQEVPINGRTNIDISLQPETFTGEEIFVTGYSSQRQSDITGAVSGVEVDDMNKITSANFLEKMKGRISGVQVESNGSPGSRSTVRIRGVSSFQNNDPLYIIDGTPIQGDYNNFLNPSDIESMQVLKDASAASIYGARASNGVVIITTKKGTPGDTQVSMNASWGVATPVKGYDDFLIQDPFAYHEVIKRSHDNAGLSTPTNIYGDPNNPSIPNYIWPNDGTNQTNDLSQFGLTEEDFEVCNCDNLIMPASQGTNWWDELFSPALTQNYNLNISGGTEGATYNVSFNYYDQDGTMKYNYYKKGSIRVNTQFEAGIFTFGENASFTVDQTTGGMQSGDMGEDTPVGQLIKMQPIIPVHAINGQYFGGAKANTLGNGSNPIAQVWKNRNDVTESNQFVGNAFVTAALYEGLEFKSSLGFNVGRLRNEDFALPTPENSEPNSVTSLGEGYDIYTNWTWSNTLTYVTTLGQNHNLNALAGAEANRSNDRFFDGSMAGYITDNPNARYIQDALGDPATKNVSTSGGFNTLLSYFGKVDYNYAQKYYLSATIRRDGSSRLGSTNQWGTFPAFSIGWRVSEESFMQGLDVLDDLKLRAAYGVTGNQQIPTGRTVDQFGGSTGSTFYDITGSNSGIAQGFRKTDIGNDDLKWEENVSYNFGIDAEFLGGRLNFVLDLYQREVDDLLFNPAIPATQGNASAPWRNVGKMRNTGIDVSLGYRGTISNDLTWNINVNGSHYKNEIVHIAGDQDFFFGPETGRQDILNINQLGYSIGSFYGFKTDGIFQNQAEVDTHVSQDGAAPGRFRFVDVNDDGQITAADRTIIGSYHPDFTGGLNLGLQWKNWDFNTFLFASIGNDIFDLTKEFTVFRLFNTNVRRDLLTESAVVENGEVQNPGARYPQLDQNDQFSNSYSDFYVEDASYLRMQNIEIGYNVPVDILPGLSNMRMYVQAQNLFTITGYRNVDPNLPSIPTGDNVDASDQLRGVDRGTYPNNRIFSFGINASF
ncbi:TonB-dependent receptor [Aliifodinibius sp. S!AR15-10]|uniref:SusC/RagA family TonB-linked outer membrane protein n=1 Tax=Aliifodinibius sp. S!AR15-10 TaxID=2950437 RepID=UPI0028624A9C|nr:TonB-dependent receptor [Aliifodinibius sp. S!AR15-10]MDR8392895.1 TonB-dependent receptor [Aliifodinibius sp. S!AR15-10]